MDSENGYPCQDLCVVAPKRLVDINDGQVGRYMDSENGYPCQDLCVSVSKEDQFGQLDRPM